MSKIRRIVLLFVIIGGFSFLAYNTSSLKNDITLLKSDVNKVEKLTRTISSLENELQLIKQTLRRGKLSDSPTFRVRFKPDSSHLDDPFLGPDNASVIIMAFNNYQCSPCRDFALNTFPLIKENYLVTNKVKFILRDFPLNLETNATTAAELAHCAGEQGHYWRAHDVLYENPINVDTGEFDKIVRALPVDHERLTTCLTSNRYKTEIKADIAEGVRIGVRGAPGFFIGRKHESGEMSGTFIRGAQPYEVVKIYLDNLLGVNDNK
jgi:protein-disulfide isomerase